LSDNGSRRDAWFDKFVSGLVNDFFGCSVCCRAVGFKG
jgi:hypothetical protein